jgi:lipoyl synthase
MNRLPEWLRRSIPTGSSLQTHSVLNELRLNTVCESALCPNRPECYSQSTATFMILGDVCTRRCGFCVITTGHALNVERDEPLRVAEAAKRLGLTHVVVTSVARDDLDDEGAGHFYETICAIKREIPNATVEVLTPDFHGRRELIREICGAKPDVFNHNIETVSRLQKKVRPQARYERSLSVLNLVKECDGGIKTKSGLMLGLGETIDEVKSALFDLHQAGVDIVTLGQYLKPEVSALAVEQFVHPEIFAELEEVGRKIGFSEVYSGPYVRSSYHAGETYAKSLSYAVNNTRRI